MNGENSVKCKRNLGVFVCVRLSGHCMCASVERGRCAAAK